MQSPGLYEKAFTDITRAKYENLNWILKLFALALLHEVALNEESGQGSSQANGENGKLFLITELE